MDFKNDLVTGSNDPIVRDVPMYDASDVALGELLMLGNTSAGSGDSGVAFQTAYEGSQSLQAVDALGICMEAETPTSTQATPFEYYKAIINPFAVYSAEYSQGTSDDIDCDAISASTAFTDTTIEDNIDCGWIYCPLASGGAKGLLRYISASAAGTATLSQAITTTTSDTYIKILPPNHALVNLTTDAKRLTSQVAAGSGVSILIMSNWIVSSRYAMLEMNKLANWKKIEPETGAHPTDTMIYADISLLDHIYNPA